VIFMGLRMLSKLYFRRYLSFSSLADYIVQGRRFIIIENLGCEPDTYQSAPTIVLIWLPQLLPCLLTVVYAALALYNFTTYRRSFTAYFQSSDSALTTTRYLRLVAISLILMCWGPTFLPLRIYVDAKSGLNPWISWAHVHYNISRVDFVPAAKMSSSELSMWMALWAAIPSASFIFFLCYSFSEESQKGYHKMWLAFRHHVIRRDVEQAQASKRVSINSNRRPLHIAMVELTQDAEEKKLYSSQPPLSHSSTPSSDTI